MINVTYDGKYPCACMGRLVIKDNDNKIYNKEFCCHSTGSVWFDNDWNDHVARGELIWEYKEPLKTQVAEQILNLFKAEVDKLTVIDYEKLRIMTGLSFSDKAKLDIDDVLEAQLDDTKKQLLDLMEE